MRGKSIDGTNARTHAIGRFMTWPEQQLIERHAPERLRNVVRIITETGLRVYKELLPLKKEEVAHLNAKVQISDSKTPNGVAELALTELAIRTFRNQILLAGTGEYLFPSDLNTTGHQQSLRTVWWLTLKRAGGVADEWVTQLLRQGDAKVFKKYSPMKLQMQHEALLKINRHANEMPAIPAPTVSEFRNSGTVLAQWKGLAQQMDGRARGKSFRINVCARSSVG
jgi:hypothetical protein